MGQTNGRNDLASGVGTCRDASFAPQLVVKRGHADAKCLEGVHGMSVVHSELVLAHLHRHSLFALPAECHMDQSLDLTLTKPKDLCKS